jgi:hypothetical protein
VIEGHRRRPVDLDLRGLTKQTRDRKGAISTINGYSS